MNCLNCKSNNTDIVIGEYYLWDSVKREDIKEIIEDVPNRGKLMGDVEIKENPRFNKKNKTIFFEDK